MAKIYQFPDREVLKMVEMERKHQALFRYIQEAYANALRDQIDREIIEQGIELIYE